MAHLSSSTHQRGSLAAGASQRPPRGSVRRVAGDANIPTARLALPAPLADWRVVGAAVSGAAHIRADLPCQDVQASLVLPDGTLLVALADGAGSAPLSAQGAQWAVAAALSALQAARLPARVLDQAAWQTLFREVFAAARAAVWDLAVAAADDARTDPQRAARAYACTLTCVVASSDGLAAAQIGDGAVVAARADGALFAVTHLQRGEYANETHFLTQADALEQLAVEVSAGAAHALAVMSDGLIRLALKLPEQEPHLPFFTPLFGFARADVADAPQRAVQLADFLASERVNARTDDDKSLVLAVRVPASASSAAAQGGTP